MESMSTTTGRSILRKKRKELQSYFEMEAQMLETRAQHQDSAAGEFTVGVADGSLGTARWSIALRIQSVMSSNGMQGKLCLQREREAFLEALYRLSNSEYRSAIQPDSPHCMPLVDMFSGQQRWTIISAALPPADALQVLFFSFFLSFIHSLSFFVSNIYIYICGEREREREK